MLDLGCVRAQFPGLAGDWIFFDNAGGSQILGRAVDRIVEFLIDVERAARRLVCACRSSPPSASPPGSARSRAGSTATPTSWCWARRRRSSLANLAAAMAGELAPGDEIVVTDVDHESNIGCWRRLAAARGAIIKEWRVDGETLALRVEELAPLLTDKTRLVCFTHASNLVGTVHDVAAITRFVHERGARVCVDGVAYAPHRPLDVRGWDVDYYVCSASTRFYGPHLAALYGKREHLRRAHRHQPLLHRGGALQAAAGPRALRAGARAAGAVVDYLESLDFGDVAAHERALAARLLDLLDGTRGVRVLGERSASSSRGADHQLHRRRRATPPTSSARSTPRASASSTATSTRAASSIGSASARAAASCARRWSTTTRSRRSHRLCAALGA